MPKKAVHGRTKSKSNRPRRQVQAGGAAGAAVAEEGIVPATSAAPVRPQSYATAPAAPAGARPANAPRRGVTGGRRAPVLAVNYHYLRRDIRSLAVLAPAMVVLLIIAYFVFH